MLIPDRLKHKDAKGYKFWVIFKRDTPNWRETTDFSLIGLANTIEEAKNARGATGDLVVHGESLKVVNSQDWLFDWEKNNPSCYSQRQIRSNGDQVY